MCGQMIIKRQFDKFSGSPGLRIGVMDPSLKFEGKIPEFRDFEKRINSDQAIASFS